jgi:hypothetical protein
MTPPSVKRILSNSARKRSRRALAASGVIAALGAYAARRNANVSAGSDDPEIDRLRRRMEDARERLLRR